MKLVKSKPRYKCDFCRRQSTKPAMERHERRCYMNPDRVCDACDNTGIATIEYASPPGYGVEYKEVECEFCKKYDRSALERKIQHDKDVAAGKKPEVDLTEEINF